MLYLVARGIFLKKTVWADNITLFKYVTLERSDLEISCIHSLGL